jgi:tetratricopeptide (TPR) repeat protein
LAQYREAFADCNQALTLDPDYADGYNRRGAVYAVRADARLGLLDDKRAIDDFQIAANLYDQQGDTTSAQEMLARLKQLKL